MGVVSSVAQQIEPNDSMEYIQTDAALAPGSSGGPLVDIDGGIVGINVFSLTERGKELGLGFAVPSSMVRLVYTEIRQYGSVPRGYLGVDVQGITPTLAAALHLPAESGVIVADVSHGSLAEKAALQAGDVILAVDGKPIRNVPQLSWALLHKLPDDHVSLGVWRKSGQVVFDLTLVARPPDSQDPIPAVDIEENAVSNLGIVASVRNHKATGSHESISEVLVAARLRGTDSQAELVAGDVIRSVNGMPITSVKQLRSLIDAFKLGDAIALQVERKGKLMYVAFEID